MARKLGSGHLVSSFLNMLVILVVIFWIPDQNVRLQCHGFHTHLIGPVFHVIQEAFVLIRPVPHFIFVNDAPCSDILEDRFPGIVPVPQIG